MPKTIKQMKENAEKQLAQLSETADEANGVYTDLLTNVGEDDEEFDDIAGIQAIVGGIAASLNLLFPDDDQD